MTKFVLRAVLLAAIGLLMLGSVAPSGLLQLGLGGFLVAPLLGEPVFAGALAATGLSLLAVASWMAHSALREARWDSGKPLRRDVA